MKPTVEALGEVLRQPIVIGAYTLFERFGRGVMADIFKARMRGTAGFERTVVIKRILPHLARDPSFTKMLVEEAKIAGKLSHPNIVQVLELGNLGNEHFVSMEYVCGHDLSATMRTLWERMGPPRPEVVAFIGREMCRGLAYAHDFTSDDEQVLGIIHRDVSPSNVMISYDGAVKLLDFGIAKALRVDADEESTKVGMLKGKMAYMAPEQLASREVDGRIDIFATGVVLHEALSGRRLFKRENAMQTIDCVRRCKVKPPSSFNPLCSRELDNIVMKAVAKNPDKRYQSASEMADQLDDVVHAARFNATDLAQTMRDLFPRRATGELPIARRSHRPRLATDSVSVSRPIPLPTPSPLVPAVEVRPATNSDVRRHTLKPWSNVAVELRQAVRRLAQRLVASNTSWVAMLALLVLGFGFMGGMTWILSSRSVRTGAPVATSSHISASAPQPARQEPSRLAPPQSATAVRPIAALVKAKATKPRGKRHGKRTVLIQGGENPFDISVGDTTQDGRKECPFR